MLDTYQLNKKLMYLVALPPITFGAMWFLTLPYTSALTNEFTVPTKVAILSFCTFLSSFIILLFFALKLKKDLIIPTSAIDKVIDDLINHGLDFHSPENSLYSPLFSRLRKLSLSLKKSHDEYEQAIKESSIKLREAYKNIEAQNSEIKKTRNEATKANNAKSDFLANTSHEIRTPLNGIIGFTELLEKTSLSSQQIEYLETIKLSANTLLLNVNDVTDLSRLESGKLNLDYKSINISEIIIEANGSFLKQQAPKDKYSLNLEICPNNQLPEKLQGDPVRIKQTYNNLLLSAVTLNTNGTIEISTHVEYTNDNRVELKVSLSNNNCGDLSHEIHKINTLLSQAEGNADDKFTNKNHIRLIVAQALATKMDGGIGVSAETEKCTFWFTIRLALPTPTNTDSLNISQSAPSILLVDDNASNRRLVCEFLKNSDISITCAESGEDALSLLKTQNFSLIFMDIQMPGINGFETANEIRKCEPENMRTPIVALTAHAVEEDKSKILISGMDDFISKPINDSQLNELLERWTHYSRTAENHQPPPRTQPSTDKAPVNVQLCLKLSNGKAELARDMLTMLIDSLGAEVGALRKSWREQDIEQLHETVHRLHGGACYCGVPTLLRVSAELDKDLKDKRIENLSSQLEQLIAACQELLSWREAHDLDILFK
ncbi:MAG: CheY-like chemotaxis protein/signal transduction histidine kinase [Lentisphaeria bacterium]|jgi:CheY-like chemotaxis protein/signal transduction histidine kinase